MSSTRETALGYARGLKLPDGYAFRPVTPADAAAVAELMNSHARSIGDHDSVTAEFVRHEWTAAGFELADGAIAIEGPRGALAGYEEVFDQGSHLILGIYGGVVHPDHAGRGLRASLIRWADRRAAPHAALADPGKRVAIRLGVERRDTAGGSRLKEARYRIARHFWHMERDLAAPVEPAEWPADIRVRPMAPGEERRFQRVEWESFRGHWGMPPLTDEQAWERFRVRMLGESSFDPALFFGAFEGDELVAVCLTFPAHEGDPTVGWIADLGVRTPWRRLGIGRALLLHSFAEHRRRGLPRARLGVDSENETGATGMYERAGMRVIRRYDVWEKTIREGSPSRGEDSS